MEWHIDIGEVLKASDTGYRFFLIAVDKFSQLVELHPLRTQTAKEVATVLYRQIYCRYGICNVTTDRGSCFVSDLLKHVNQLFHIKHSLSTPQNSKANGTAENTVRRVKSALRIYCRSGDIKKWVEFLSIIAMSFKAMPSTVTGYSPFELIHGMQMKTAFDHAIATVSAQLPQEVNTILTNLR